MVLVLLLWQALGASGWRPRWLLPWPADAGGQLLSDVHSAEFYRALGTTLARALAGYAAAIVVGSVIGIAMSASSKLRSALGSLITGLQTMPSITWFPLAILLFQLSEAAILFVVVLGAAPSIANGLLSGIDHVAPDQVRAGRILGARRFALYRSVIIPAAMPSILGGFKQAWAFAWRSLMAGELLVVVPGHPSIGAQMEFARDLPDPAALIALMVVVLLLGIGVDAVFAVADRRIRVNRGLLQAAA
jgi:NitT/TauT family transport system permease protein